MERRPLGVLTMHLSYNVTSVSQDTMQREGLLCVSLEKVSILIGSKGRAALGSAFTIQVFPEHNYFTESEGLCQRVINTMADATPQLQIRAIEKYKINYSKTFFFN
jgi:hypothetical protein